MNIKSSVIALSTALILSSATAEAAVPASGTLSIVYQSTDNGLIRARIRLNTKPGNNNCTARLVALVARDDSAVTENVVIFKSKRLSSNGKVTEFRSVVPGVEDLDGSNLADDPFTTAQARITCKDSAGNKRVFETNADAAFVLCGEGEEATSPKTFLQRWRKNVQ